MKQKWTKKKLGEVCKISSTLVDPRSSNFLNMLHIGAGNMISESEDLVDIKTARDEELISGKFLFDRSMVLYSKIRPYLKKVARPEFDGLCSADIYPLSPNIHELNRDFLFHLLMSKQFTEYAIEGSNRAGMPKVNREHLFNFTTYFPTLPEQKRIVSIVDEAFEAIDIAIDNTKQNLTNARELFDSYLNAIFTQKDDGWVETSLGELIDISHGYAFKGNDFETSNDLSKAIVLTPGNYSENSNLYFTSKNTKRLIAVAPPSNYIFNLGDLTVVMTDLSSKMKILGKPAFVESENILHNQRIGRVIFKSESINSRYLFYFLRTKVVSGNIKNTATGTMVRHTAPQRILSNTILIPKALGDQVYITSKLDEIEIETQRLEAVYQQKLTALNELKQSILHKAFTGELTADKADLMTNIEKEAICT